MIELWVPGKPRGKDRPRFNTRTGRTFTTPETRQAEAAIVAAWESLDSDSIPDGAAWLELNIIVERPMSHYRKNGELSAEGLRNEFPHKQKPDVDNCLKLVMDALNGRAYTDDVRVIRATVQRSWGSEQGLLIRLGPIYSG